MSAPELSNIDKTMHDILRRVIAESVIDKRFFARLSDSEEAILRKRLLALSNVHALIKKGETYPNYLITVDNLRGWFPEYLAQVFSPFVGLPFAALSTCQVVNPAVQDAFKCPYREQGQGDRVLVCESAGEGRWHDHKISNHTQLHDEMGDGHSCDAIDLLLTERQIEGDTPR